MSRFTNLVLDVSIYTKQALSIEKTQHKSKYGQKGKENFKRKVSVLGGEGNGVLDVYFDFNSLSIWEHSFLFFSFSLSCFLKRFYLYGSKFFGKVKSSILHETDVNTISKYVKIMFTPEIYIPASPNSFCISRCRKWTISTSFSITCNKRI